MTKSGFNSLCDEGLGKAALSIAIVAVVFILAVILR